jgi:hypothetical protein
MAVTPTHARRANFIIMEEFLSATQVPDYSALLYIAAVLEASTFGIRMLPVQQLRTAPAL